MNLPRMDWLVLVLGLGLVIVNIAVGWNDANPSPVNIGGNIRKAVTGK